MIRLIMNDVPRLERKLNVGFVGAEFVGGFQR